jgi:hypothetical protein
MDAAFEKYILRSKEFIYSTFLRHASWKKFHPIVVCKRRTYKVVAKV